MITKRIPIAIAVLLAALAPHAAAQTPGAPTPQGKLVAVVIGVSKYAKLGGGQQLQFADRDAMLIADALKKTGVAADNLRVLTGQEATVAGMKSALGNWLARAAGADDTVLIFFSGHGFFEQEFGEAYLLAADSDVKEAFATGLSLSDIRQALTARVRARRVLLITDALRRDFFDPETGSNAAAGFLRAFDQLATARAGLSVIAASGPGEYSREGQRWNGQGVFAKHLAAALTTGQYIDRNNDGVLTADEMIEVIAPLVAEDTANKQHIWHSNTPLAQFAFASLPHKTEVPAVAAKEAKITKPEPPSAPGARPDVAAVPLATAKPSTTTPPFNRDSSESAKPQAPVIIMNSQPADKVIAKVEPVAAPPASKPASAPVTPARKPAATPPTIASVTANEAASAPAGTAVTNPIAEGKVSPPPRPLATLPRVNEVAAEPARRVEPIASPSPAPASTIEAAPSPLILQLEAAIAAKNLLEPKQSSAWEIYQKLAADPATASEAARLRPALAEALTSAGRNIVAGQVYSDSIADRVDDFRRAGQMLARARTLKPESPEISTLEKLSAAQALIALQFYDEAERALAQLQGVKLAAVENAMGLVYQGKLDNFRAERAFKRAVEIDPSWAAPHFNLALLYRGQQNEAALPELEQAAALDAKNVALLVALGDEYFAKQQWPRAADTYRKAIAIKPNDDNLHTKLGHALYSQGLQAEADREYQKARELRTHQQ
ncbi:MAG TPA: tetratricopeptide repeat protein [Blastocatellia bacterium]|nr:tetratricopeptide repeat protein [Blastocatellia bacterium]